MTRSSSGRCSRCAPSPTAGSRTRRTNSAGWTRWIAAGSRSAGTSSVRSAVPNWRSSAATTPPGCASTANARSACARYSSRESPRRSWSRGPCSASRWRSARTRSTRRATTWRTGRRCTCPAARARSGCLAPGARSSTIRPSGCCCPHSGPGGCCAGPRPRRTRSGCSRSPTGSATSGRPRR